MATSARTRRATSELRRRPQLSEDVANHVRNLIMSGSVRPGEFVRLDETAADLGVSVTPVREALVALRGEGMVELVPHRGYLVSPLSRQDIEDIFWLQGQIAVKLALRAMDSITADQLAELTELNADLRAGGRRFGCSCDRAVRIRVPSPDQSRCGWCEVGMVPVRRDSVHPCSSLRDGSRLG